MSKDRIRKRKIRLWARRILTLGCVILLLGGVTYRYLTTRLYFSFEHFPAVAGLHADSMRSRTARPPIVIGHRGSADVAISNGQLLGLDGQAIKPGGKPLRIGNSRMGISRAIDAGVSWIEIDLRTTADGQLVVFHDASLFPRVHSAPAGSRLSDFDSGELSEMFLAVQPPQHVPRLKDFDHWISKPGVNWIFDLKDERAAGALCRWLDTQFAEQHLTPERVVVFADFEILSAFVRAREAAARDKNEALKQVALGYTALWAEPGSLSRVLFRRDEILDRARQLECEYLVLPVGFVSTGMIDAAEKSRLQVWVYGSDDPRDHRAMQAMGVHGLITDFPVSVDMRFEMETK